MTLASISAIQRHEIREALRLFFPKRVTRKPFRLLGFDVWHAGNYPARQAKLEGAGVARIAPEIKVQIEAIADSMLSEALLSGTIMGEAAPTTHQPWLRFDDDFLKYLADWQGLTDHYSRELVDRAAYARCMVEILDLINDELQEGGIDADEFAQLGLSGFIQFMDAMPMTRIRVHLHQQWAKNRDLKPARSTLNDWFYLSAAAAYSDVIVTEKLFADLVRREGLVTKAQVLTGLEKLPSALIAETNIR